MASSLGAAARASLQSIKTPPYCLADFCLIPIGTGSASVSREVTEVQRLVEKSGLKFVLHSAGTTVEGSWDEVHRLIGQAHTVIHEQGAVRIQTDMRVGTRIDKHQTMQDKVDVVKKNLEKKE